MKNLKEEYTFLALFHNEGKLGYSITFPNFDECFTYADTFEEGLTAAQDVLEFYIYGRVEDGDKLPTPLNKEDVEIHDKKNDTVIEITVNMDRYKENIMKHPIDRGEYVPTWLKEIAQKNKESLGDSLDELIIELKKDLEDN